MNDLKEEFKFEKIEIKVKIIKEKVTLKNGFFLIIIFDLKFKLSLQVENYYILTHNS